MEQVKVKMSENCEQVFNTLLKGCGLTREDLNETNFDNWDNYFMYTSEDFNVSLEFAISNLIELLSSINYELLYCDYGALCLIQNAYGLPNEQYSQFIERNVFQIVFDCKDKHCDNMIVFEVDNTCSCATYFIERAIFIEETGNTILFEKNKGFITTQEQTALTEEQSNSTNNKDLETRVNNIEEKLDTLIKMLSK